MALPTCTRPRPNPVYTVVAERCRTDCQSVPEIPSYPDRRRMSLNFTIREERAHAHAEEQRCEGGKRQNELQSQAHEGSSVQKTCPEAAGPWRCSRGPLVRRGALKRANGQAWGGMSRTVREKTRSRSPICGYNNSNVTHRQHAALRGPWRPGNQRKAAAAYRPREPRTARST